jgi:NAD(P)-dependent dehydrogenase (short-subunit alcohol dehydrogenase family)
MGKLDGNIALVTGGNSGIGVATAKRFVQEGAYVFITGRRDLELDAAARAIGRNVTGVRGDVSNLGDLDRLYAQLKRDKGKLDVLFANTGVERGEPRLHRHARTARPAGVHPNGPATLEDAFQRGSTRQAGYTR